MQRSGRKIRRWRKREGLTPSPGTRLSEHPVPVELASPTFRFLVTCVRCVFDASALAQLAAIDRSSIDWDLLRRLARENRVDVLLFHGLRMAPAETVPPDVIASLNAYEHDNRRRNDASLAGARYDPERPRRTRIACLVFKGPVLGHLAYPDPGMRFFWDLDLLVRDTDLPAVHDALRSLRYQRDELSGREEKLYARYHFAHTYSPAVDGPDIDVHWSLFPANFPVPVDYNGLRERSVPVDVGGIRATTFSREDTLVYVALHGAKEEWRRLQMIVDVAAIVAAEPALDWERCLRIAGEWHARRQLFLALHLASEWMGATLPAAVVQRDRLRSGRLDAGRRCAATAAATDRPRHVDLPIQSMADAVVRSRGGSRALCMAHDQRAADRASVTCQFSAASVCGLRSDPPRARLRRDSRSGLEQAKRPEVSERLALTPPASIVVPLLREPLEWLEQCVRFRAGAIGSRRTFSSSYRR